MDEVKVAMRHFSGSTLQGQLGTSMLDIDIMGPPGLEVRLIDGDSVSRAIERLGSDMMLTLLLWGRVVTPSSIAGIGEA